MGLWKFDRLQRNTALIPRRLRQVNQALCAWSSKWEKSICGWHIVTPRSNVRDKVVEELMQNLGGRARQNQYPTLDATAATAQGRQRAKPCNLASPQALTGHGPAGDVNVSAGAPASFRGNTCLPGEGASTLTLQSPPCAPGRAEDFGSRLERSWRPDREPRDS
ncbi:hypothetical protein G7046_g924 [Stylonectria norvegica]|nr:hypothetical protein G7046_g924 [Stylonectria norvegica]